MSQNILTTPREEFAKEIHRLNFATLKSLLEGLFTFIKNNSDKMPEDCIIDLERKQTLIWKEIKRRGYKLDDNFTRWLYSKHKRRLF